VIALTDALVRETVPGLFGDDEAVFSADGTYRYLLTRRWAEGGTTCTFAMLNPSKATAAVTDPTVTRCIGFARREGASALAVVNLHALRATDPAELAKHPDPTGPCNDAFILEHCQPGQLVIAAWGSHGILRGRGLQVAVMLDGHGVDLKCFGVTKAGMPLHPLYQRADAPLSTYAPGGAT